MLIQQIFKCYLYHYGIWFFIPSLKMMTHWIILITRASVSFEARRKTILPFNLQLNMSNGNSLQINLIIMTARKSLFDLDHVLPPKLELLLRPRLPILPIGQTCNWSHDQSFLVIVVGICGQVTQITTMTIIFLMRPISRLVYFAMKLYLLFFIWNTELNLWQKCF